MHRTSARSLSEQWITKTKICAGLLAPCSTPALHCSLPAVLSFFPPTPVPVSSRYTLVRRCFQYSASFQSSEATVIAAGHLMAKVTLQACPGCPLHTGAPCHPHTLSPPHEIGQKSDSTTALAWQCLITRLNSHSATTRTVARDVPERTLEYT